MYRVVLIQQNERTPLPRSNGPQGRLFETKKEAVKFGRVYERKHPKSTFAVEQYGPISRFDWLICDSCKAALRLRSIESQGGCWRCGGGKIIQGPLPPLFRRLHAVLKEWRL